MSAPLQNILGGKKNDYLNTDTQRTSHCDTTWGLLHCNCAVVIWGVSHLKLHCEMHILRLYHKHGNFRIKRHAGFFQQPGGCSTSGRWKGTAASLPRIPALSTTCQPEASIKNCLKRPSNNYYNPLAWLCWGLQPFLTSKRLQQHGSLQEPTNSCLY